MMNFLNYKEFLEAITRTSDKISLKSKSVVKFLTYRNFLIKNQGSYNLYI